MAWEARLFSLLVQQYYSRYKLLTRPGSDCNGTTIEMDPDAYGDHDGGAHNVHALKLDRMQIYI